MSATTSPTSLRRGAATAPGRGWLRPVAFDPRNNSLNLIRLVLALLVLVSHTFPIAGWGDGPMYADENLGGWAVIGFFVLSGYLIMGSRVRTDAGTYLMHRVARIFPAFLVCLVVTALAFAPIGYWRLNGTLSGFFTTANTPANYVFANSFLRMSDYSVAGTPGAVPYPGAWNGSLWSLYFEFLCYIVVGLLAFVPLVRRSARGIAVAFAVSVVAQIRVGDVVALFGGNGEIPLLAKLLPYFLGGALLYMLKDRIRFSAPFALLAAGVSFATISFVPSWGGQLVAPLVAYALLWVSLVLPAPRLILRNDVSYGAYIYAFPVQQLVVIFGGHTLGLVPYVLICTAVTAVLATASWIAVERPVMRRVRRGTSSPAPAATPAAVTPG